MSQRMQPPSAPPRSGGPTGLVATGLLTAAAVLAYDFLHVEPPPVSGALAGAVLGYGALVAALLAVGGLLVRGALRVLGGNARARWIASLAFALPFLLHVLRSSGRLFDGGVMRRLELGGAGPVLAALAMVAGLATSARAAQHLARCRPRTCALALLLAALVLAEVNRRAYAGLYLHLHELLSAVVHGLVFAALAAAGAGRLGGRRPAAAGWLALGVLAAGGAVHLSTHTSAPQGVRKLFGYELGTTRHVVSVLPYAGRREPFPDSPAELSARALRQMRLRERARRQLAATELAGPLNVLFVSVDALRADHSSLLGYTRPTTPFLDEIAAESHVFTQARSPATASFFSITSMLSGVHPASIARLGGANPAMLSRHLGELGYATAVYYQDIILTMRPREWPDADRTMGFAEVHEMNAQSTRVFDRILDFLDRPRDGAFFAYAHVMDPHSPYVKRPGHDFGDEAADAYDSEIAHVDAELRRLWAGVRERGLAETTVLVITADHGEGLGEHGRFHHGSSVYDFECHVPLVIRVPGWRRPPPRIDAPVSCASISPTLTDLLRVPPTAGEEAPSLLPLMTGVDDGSDAFAVIEMPVVMSRPGKALTRAVVRGGYKLINDLRLDLQRLYDLGQDPDETRDVASERPEVVERLLALEREWVTDLRARRASRAVASDDDLPVEYRYLRDEILGRDLRRAGELPRYLDHEDARVRRDAAILLFDLEIDGEPGSASALVEASARSGAPAILRTALSFARGEKSRAADLLAALDDEDVQLRRRAAIALRRGGAALGDVPAGRIARETDRLVRFELVALRAAGGDAGVLDALLELIFELKGRRRAEATRLLLAFDDATLGGRLDTLIRRASPLLRVDVLRHLGQVDTPKRRALIDGHLRSPQLQQRANGLMAVEGFVDDDFRRDRLARIARFDTDPKLRVHAAQALASHGGPGVGAALLAAVAAHAETAALIGTVLMRVVREPLVSPDGIVVRRRPLTVTRDEPRALPLGRLEGDRPWRFVGACFAPAPDATAELVIERPDATALSRVSCRAPATPVVFDVDPRKLDEVTLRIRPGSGAGVWYFPDFILVPVRDVLELWPADVTEPGQPYALTRFSPEWVTSLDDPAHIWLRDDHGTYRFFGQPERPPALRIAFRNLGGGGRIVARLNGRPWPPAGVAGAGDCEVVLRDCSAYRPGEPNTLELEVVPRQAEAPPRLGLRRLVWR